MYKIVIADDEKIERTAMSMKIRKNIERAQVCCEAEDGETLIAAVREYQPDIIIVDIEMPGMTGLEAVSCIREEGLMNGGKILIYTAYGQFEYAQKALQQKVDDYILKPVTLKKLIETIEGCIDQLQKEREETEKQHELLGQVKERISEDFIHAISTPNITADQKKLFQFVLGEKYSTGVVVAFSFDAKGDFDSEEDRIHLIKCAQKKLKKKICEYEGLIVEKTGLEMYGFIPLEKDSVCAEKYGTCDLVERIVRETGVESNMEIRAGIGHAGCNHEEMFESYRESFRVLHDTSQKNRIKHIIDFEEEKIENPFCIDSKKWLSCVQNGEESIIKTSINLNFYKGRNLTKMQMVDNLLDATLQHAGVMHRWLLEDQRKEYTPVRLFESIKRANNKEQLKDWFVAINKKMASDIQKNTNKNNNDWMQKAIGFIGDYYWKDISLDMVAAEIGINSYYLSHMFTNEFGENYSTYLNRFRIERACELLRKYSYSTQEVAEKVGFNSVSYFSKVFKKRTGFTVNEYKRQME